MVVRSLRFVLAALLVATGLVAGTAQAGPPFITDDPVPTDLGHWEIYNFANVLHEGGSTSLDAGFDLNYGAIRDVQLTATLPLHRESGVPLDVGDVQLAAKYRFLHQGKWLLPLDVTFFPRVILPTGRGSTQAQFLLPIWVEHDAGRWQFFGGGGYTINPGAGNRDYWVQGAVALRQMRHGWQLGVEEYHQGASEAGGRPVTGLTMGTLVHLKGPFSLIGSAGGGLNRRQTVAYTALKFDF